MAFKQIETMNGQELKSFIDSFDTILCDCYGTLWNDHGPYQGVPDTWANLQKNGKHICLVVNGSLLGVDAIYKHTKELKIDVESKDIVIPVLAMLAYLKKIHFQKEIFVLGTQTVKELFVDAGFTVANMEKDKPLESFTELVVSLKDNINIGAVVFDFDLNLSYANILKSIVYLTRPDVIYLIGTNEKRMPSSTPGKTIEGQFRFQNLITEVTGKTPIKFAKPSQFLNEYIKNTQSINKARTLVVGDSLSDMDFAKQAGYKKLMVLNGMTSYKQALEASEDLQIDYYINNFGEMSKVIKGKLNIFSETVELVGGAFAALNLHF